MDMKETSLDDFASSSDEADESTAEDESADSETATETVDETAIAETEAEEDTITVEPARITGQWSPEGTACHTCGEEVERLWVDDGGRVCGACKDWN